MTGIAAHGKRLVVTGWIYAYKTNVSWEWRRPSDDKFVHPISDLPAAEFATPPIERVATVNFSTVAPKYGADVGLSLTDVTPSLKIGAPKRHKHGSRQDAVPFHEIQCAPLTRARLF